MAEPETTGEAIQIVRRALYDLARKPGANNNGQTMAELLTHLHAGGGPVPIQSFGKVIDRLREAGAVTTFVSGGSDHSRYRLTAKGDLEEETARTSWLTQVLSEAKRPATVVGFALGLLSGLVLALVGVAIAALVRAPP